MVDLQEKSKIDPFIVLNRMNILLEVLDQKTSTQQSIILIKKIKLTNNNKLIKIKQKFLNILSLRHNDIINIWYRFKIT